MAIAAKSAARRSRAKFRPFSLNARWRVWRSILSLLATWLRFNAGLLSSDSSARWTNWLCEYIGRPRHYCSARVKQHNRAGGLVSTPSQALSVLARHANPRFRGGNARGFTAQAAHQPRGRALGHFRVMAPRSGHRAASALARHGEPHARGSGGSPAPTLGGRRQARGRAA